MKMTPKARRILKERRRAGRIQASVAAHRRAVQWFGSFGDRCYECQDVPLRVWEQQ